MPKSKKQKNIISDGEEEKPIDVEGDEEVKSDVRFLLMVTLDVVCFV